MILNYIKNMNLSNSSKEQMFFMVGRYLDIKNKNKHTRNLLPLIIIKIE